MLEFTSNFNCGVVQFHICGTDSELYILFLRLNNCKIHSPNGHDDENLLYIVAWILQSGVTVPVISTVPSIISDSYSGN